MGLPLSRVGLAYAACLLVFLVLDIGWISFVVVPLYRGQIPALMLPKPGLAAAVAFYLLYLAGLVFFAVAPALRAQSWAAAVGNGAAYGFFCYMTYALTNLSILRGWTMLLVVSDIFWGIAASAITATIAYWAVRRIGG